MQLKGGHMKHIVSFSGGKDSTAMLIRMIELDYKIDRIIFADTKYEFPEMYEYIEKVQDFIGREIEVLRTNQKFEDWFYGEWTRGNLRGQKRGFPKVVYPCYWSRESKFKVLEKECKGNIRYIGIAYDERHRETNNEGYKYPLIEWSWTEMDCIRYLERIDLINPLYEKFDRLGCWWCPKQSRKSLESLYRYYPDLWDKFLELDKDSPHDFKPNRTLKSLELEIYLKVNQLDMFGLVI